MKIRPTEIAYYENAAIVCYIEAHEAQIEINERKEIFRMERTRIYVVQSNNILRETINRETNKKRNMKVQKQEHER